MNPVRLIARPLLATTFVVGGIEAFIHPESKAPAAEKVVGDVVDKAPGIANSKELVQADAAVKVLAGSLLALGKFPRLASLLLAGSLVPTTLAGHRFWEESDPQRKTQQQLHFMKNAGMLGGLLLAAMDTEGRPSLGYRAGKAPAVVASKVHDAQQAVQSAASSVKDKLPG